MIKTQRSQLLQRWRDAWPDALAVWSSFTQLSEPLLCASSAQAIDAGLQGSFAMIRLNDQSIVVDLAQVDKLGLHDYAVEVLAHEIGHHVLAPATVNDHFRLHARIHRGLPTLEKHAPMVANLYTDLLINDRLQRQSQLRMEQIYQILCEKQRTLTKPGVWALYMRIYEKLWRLDRGTLGVQVDDDLFESNAWLGARLVRVYANDWLTGGARFAALLLPYLHEQELDAEDALILLQDMQDAGVDCEPSGLVEYDHNEIGIPIHPSEDPLLNDAIEDSQNSADNVTPTGTDTTTALSGGQAREPFEYGDILKAAGIRLSDHDIAVRYYREAALPHLIPFPKKKIAQQFDTQIEGLEVWEMGDALDDIDWLASLSLSPHVIPGVTTMKRQISLVPGAESVTKPVDLDIYIDSSGSMPNPQRRISYAALAGAVICLSALRSGSRVQATLWSGKHQFVSTPGFIRDEIAILRILTDHFGGATAFPIHVLRDTFEKREAHERSCHILHISDNGITTMFDDDELNNSGWDIAAQALAKGNAGGTMALQIHADWREFKGTSYASQYYTDLKRAHEEQDWQIHAVTDLAQLVDFARNFSRKHYGARA